ncbi:Mu-like prophage major head subunit gpT family protein [Vibrio sp. LaRot3]|uniref:Mu-like prophage major head subunit gpT family protein n=1 Tax=Vibrio sp. LaRot3 TaxID=2998829 RepID=UPI0022CDED2D|nr:Mu-like prophage major head subunit gpT family protein [Vibrio sp. LaRot3]MDA0148849.1 Mu-like prophage major head subunit gpT family protein [Vibrio sp. LaRot3]
MNEAQILQALFTGMSAAYTDGLDAVDPQWREIATEVPSSTSANNYGWLADIPGIKEWVAERQLATVGKHAYAIENKTWETSIKVKRDDVDDDQIGMYSVLAKNFGQEVAIFPDQLSFGLLCKGFTELCFDGQPFFDTDHPMAGATYSNVIGNPDTDNGEPWFLLDTSKVLKAIIFQNRRPFVFKNMNPNEEFTWFNNEMAAGTDGRCNVGFGFWQTAIGSKAALTEENYEKAIKQMMGVTKNNGTPLDMMPKLLVVGRNNRAAAKNILERVVKASGETNIYHNDVKLLVSAFVK